MKSIITLFLTVISLTLFAQQKPLTTKEIFSRPYLIGKRPTSPNLSPDGKYLVYKANFSGTDSLYLYAQKIGEKPVKISTNKNANFVQYRKNGDSFLYSEKGEVWVYNLKSNSKNKLIQSQSGISDFTETDDQTSASFLQDNKLYTLQNREPKFSESRYKVGKDESAFIVDRLGQSTDFVIGITSDDSTKNSLVPQWMKESVYTTNSWRGSVTSYQYFKVSSDTANAVELNKKPYSGYGGNAVVSPDGKYFAYSNVVMNQHFRYIVLFDLKSFKSDTVLAFQDTAWVNVKGNVLFSPDSNYLSFTSEASNWNHLYLYDLSKKTTTQLTSGNWEIDWYSWNPENEDEIFFSSTMESPNNRPVYRLNVKSKKIDQISPTDGMRDQFSVSKNGKYIAYTNSTLKDPGDIFLLDISKKSEIRITNTVPESFKNYDLNFPSLVKINNPKLNEEFPAHLFLPKNYDSSKKYPAVIFVHGAGYLQNVANQFGYGSYWREYLFNQYLTQQGFVVLNIDFHGSEGYGRLNRISVYKDMGGADWEDEVEAAKWLVEKGYADKEKIGIYGGSYGGFLTLMGMFKSPDVFKAGAGLRSVANWELYNRWYCEQRLGSLPGNKKIYEKCSPITYADGLKNHLLILHGMVDSNVLFQDIVQLSDKLIKLNKKFDVMYYPRENHSFTEPENWLHEYEEIEAHFNKYLK